MPVADANESPKGESVQVEMATKHTLEFYLALVSILLSLFIVSLNQISLGPALPAVAGSLHASSNDAYWCGTGYVLAQTVSQPIYGSLSEVFGRKVMLQAGLATFLVTSILCARAQTIGWLIGARVVRSFEPPQFTRR
jgi:MFS family permease